MKKLKKLAALVLAAAMVLSMGITSFAAAGTITINGTRASADGDRKVYAYEMFSITKETGVENSYKYTLKTAFENFFKNAENNKYGCKDLSGTDLSDAAYEYVAKIQRGGDNTAKATFAKEALAWIIANKASLSSVEKSATSGAGSTTINVDEDGLYVVWPESASDTTATGNEIRTPAMLINVVDGQGTATIKSEYPTVDKEIVDESTVTEDGYQNIDIINNDSLENAGGGGGLELTSEVGDANADDYQIGDKVYFTLTSTVPDMTGFTSYTFKFHDNLSNGLTYGEIYHVMVGGEVLKRINENEANGENAKNTYTATYNEKTHTLTITLNKFLESYANKTGDVIEVLYDATLNKDALVGMDPNTNSAKVEFGNDPSHTDESETDTVDVHTFDFEINKVNESSKGLEGVTFTLHKDGSGSAGDEIKVILDEENSAYRPALAEETAAAAIVTGTDGKIVVKGLDAGTYWLKEVATQDGYHLLDGPIKVVITPTYDDETGKLTDYKVSYTYDGNTEEDNFQSNNETPDITIVNKDGSILPDTGGMGTVIFTVAGLALIIGVGASFVVSRRKRDAR